MQNPPSSILPTGTVTFLFTDIEGSTKRWEEHARQMSAALSRHNDLLRTTIEANGGHVFKTVGDAFCAAFSAPPDALAAAIAAQQALSALSAEEWGQDVGELRVRMALHVGVVEQRDGDYFGPTLNRVARLLSAAHGGQTLLSGLAYDLVRDYLPPDVQLLDMGEHRLKDLIRTEYIFQLVVPDLPSEFPPLKTLDNRPNNLPLQPTPLIGREKELAEVEKLLGREEVRLVTLTGPGGTGKTRLALQSAATTLDAYPDGVWFVDLSPLKDTGLVVPTIAAVLGVKEIGGQPLIDTLKAYLKDKRLLLLLDNFEQVAEAAGQVSQLLASCPYLKVLVTSRVPLRVRGEKEYPVPPLSVPDVHHLPPLERLTQYEAVRLFIERAIDVKADFQVTDENASAVTEICTRLDGLPLAIELAAARVKVLTPQAMLSRLQSRLKLLTGGAKDLPARQQTLRNTIDWSYDLLSEEEKHLFRKLAMFAGGSSLEAIEVVCNARGSDVLEGVSSLVDKSLLRQITAGGGQRRFTMLETIYEYAREKLEENGEGEAVRRQHALFFMSVAEEAEPHLRGGSQVKWLNHLDDEHDNIRTALQWAAERATAGGEIEAGEVGLRIAGALVRFWDVRGLYAEGREYLVRALSLPQATLNSFSMNSRAKGFNAAGILAWRQDDRSSARSWLETALALGLEAGDKKSASLSLHALGTLTRWRGDYLTGRPLYEQSLALRRELGDKEDIAASLVALGISAQYQGDYTGARALYEESLALRSESGDKLGISDSLHSLGNLIGWQGDYTRARALLEQSLALSRELGDKDGLGSSLFALGNLGYRLGDYPAARSLYNESLIVFKELGSKAAIAMCLGGLGGVAAELGQPQRAVRLLGAAEAHVEVTITVAGLSPGDNVGYDGGIASVQTRLSEEAFAKGWAEGRAMSMEQAIEYALQEG